MNSGTAIFQAAKSQTPTIPGKMPENRAISDPRNMGRLRPSGTAGGTVSVFASFIGCLLHLSRDFHLRTRLLSSLPFSSV